MVTHGAVEAVDERARRLRKVSQCRAQFDEDHIIVVLVVVGRIARVSNIARGPNSLAGFL